MAARLAPRETRNHRRRGRFGADAIASWVGPLSRDARGEANRRVGAKRTNGMIVAVVHVDPRAVHRPIVSSRSNRENHNDPRQVPLGLVGRAAGFPPTQKPPPISPERNGGRSVVTVRRSGGSDNANPVMVSNTRCQNLFIREDHITTPLDHSTNHRRSINSSRRGRRTHLGTLGGSRDGTLGGSRDGSPC